MKLLRQVQQRVAARRGGPGQAMVEFAFVLIIFLATMVLMFEGGRLIVTAVALSNAARDGARQGVYLPSSTAGSTAADYDTQIRTKIKNTVAPFLAIQDDHIDICRHATAPANLSYTGCDTTTGPLTRGSVIDVRVRYDFNLASLSFATGFMQMFTTKQLQGEYRARLE